MDTYIQKIIPYQFKELHPVVHQLHLLDSSTLHSKSCVLSKKDNVEFIKKKRAEVEKEKLQHCPINIDYRCRLHIYSYDLSLISIWFSCKKYCFIIIYVINHSYPIIKTNPMSLSLIRSNRIIIYILFIYLRKWNANFHCEKSIDEKNKRI